jgi:hypothetical protein
MSRRPRDRDPYRETPMAQWITRSTSNRKTAGSSPAGGDATYFKATCNGGDDDRHYGHGVHL